MAAATISASNSAVSFGGTGGGQGGQGGSPCGGSLHIDFDNDGYTKAQGDCNDCDPMVNPDAFEVITAPGMDPPADENCDGLVDNVPQSCDTGLAQDSMDPMDAAKAIGFCDFILSAKWVQADGAPPPADPAALTKFHLGHGILDDFGPVNPPREGVRLLALSSGTARKKGDPEFVHRSFDKGYTCNHPVGFPKISATCPVVSNLQPHDATGLQVEVRAPSNAQQFGFDFKFFSYEWPEYICSDHDDVFLANLEPFPPMRPDGNVSFDWNMNPITVNNVFVDACGCPAGPPCSVPPAGPIKVFGCTLGTSTLAGTDFESDELFPGWSHASTSWLQSQVPVIPGEIYKIRFVTYDSSDGSLDSLALVDHWRWLDWPPGYNCVGCIP